MMNKLKQQLYRMLEQLHRFDWFQLRQWSAWGNFPVSVYALLCLASLLLVLLPAQFFWQQDQRKNLVRQAFAIAALEQQIEAEALRLVEHGKSSGRLWQQQIILEAFLRSATAVTDPVDMLDILRDTAMEHGLDVVSLSPRLVSRDDRIYVYDMALKANGGLWEITRFVQALLAMPVYIGMNEMRIRAQENSRHQFELYADLMVAANPGGLQLVPHATLSRAGDSDRPPALSAQGGVLEPAGFLLNEFRRTQLLRDASGKLYRHTVISP